MNVLRREYKIYIGDANCRREWDRPAEPFFRKCKQWRDCLVETGINNITTLLNKNISRFISLVFLFELVEKMEFRDIWDNGIDL